jgi:tRNA-2-methylthio-N6-dimethylallyladenosine synthase
MKFFFETYGCQMNIAESAALALAGREYGWQEVANSEEADLVLLNTCSVRATAEQRVFGRLAQYMALKKKRPFTLVVAGCMAERLGEKLKKDYAVDYVMGTSARSLFPLILESVEKGSAFTKIEIETAEKPVFSFSSIHHDSSSPFRSFVPIMHGCNNFCSYCIVPYVRGRELSRSPQSILEEIRLLGSRGVKEITLLGQNVNSYLWEEGNLDFPGLLRLIASELAAESGIKWVRFLSSHPKDLSDELIGVLAENPVFCRHIHLCVQHGSNRVLSAMNRRYTREQYLGLVRRLRSAMPDLSLSTDILVGFPGETEDDLEATLALMEEVKFLYAYMYHYNPREGTAAFSMTGSISAEVKRERLSRVIALQKRHTAELLKSRVGKKASVLIEGISRKNADELISRTERDEMVVVPGKAASLGTFARVTLSSLRGNTFRSKI